MEFAEFYESARDDCLRIVLLNVGDRQLAEDLVAEGFTRAWMSWRKVRDLQAPHAWVVRTALNANVSRWRRHRREVALDGTTTLIINPRVLLEPSTLQGDLEHDGIRAMVTVGSFCSSDPAPAGFLQVMSFPGSPADPGPVGAVTIDPAAMPAGTELSFGIFQLATSQQTSFALIDTGSYTCTSTAPTRPPYHGVTFGSSSAASRR